ncbi:MAG: response regulator transcription factor [Saprospiraceae bacterium]|jgi:DNA-binding NarL/FixJ family response regulator|nr:response regulator transcription factor [Saprospiraceae bacterium]
MNQIRVSIIEDDIIVRESLVNYLELKSEISDIQAFSSVEDFEKNYINPTTILPDIIILDIQLPGKTGIQGIPIIKQIIPDTDIIMLTTFEDSEKIFDALCAGACSYLSKRSTLSSIFDCIITVSKGGSYMSPPIARKITQFFIKKNSIENPLTDRQMEIAQGIVDGLSYKMIANRLEISLDTVRTHIMQIYRTLNINCKGQLIKWALNNKIH